MEFLLVGICFFLWRVACWAKECALQLKILNETAHEHRRLNSQGLERVESQVFDLNEKMASVEDTTSAYYREFIKPMRGY